MNGEPDYVLDSTALIALLLQEPGHGKIEELLGRSAISAVNLTESIHKLLRKGLSQQIVERLIQALQLNVIDWSEALAYRSASLATLGTAQGLSLGDRACLTLARHLHATALTADRAWSQVPGLGVRVVVFR